MTSSEVLEKLKEFLLDYEISLGNNRDAALKAQVLHTIENKIQQLQNEKSEGEK